MKKTVCVSGEIVNFIANRKHSTATINDQLRAYLEQKQSDTKFPCRNLRRHTHTHTTHTHWHKHWLKAVAGAHQRIIAYEYERNVSLKPQKHIQMRKQDSDSHSATLSSLCKFFDANAFRRSDSVVTIKAKSHSTHKFENHVQFKHRKDASTHCLVEVVASTWVSWALSRAMTLFTILNRSVFLCATVRSLSFGWRPVLCVLQVNIVCVFELFRLPNRRAPGIQNYNEQFELCMHFMILSCCTYVFNWESCLHIYCLPNSLMIWTKMSFIFGIFAHLPCNKNGSGLILTIRRRNRHRFHLKIALSQTQPCEPLMRGREATEFISRFLVFSRKDLQKPLRTRLAWHFALCMNWFFFVPPRAIHIWTFNQKVSLIQAFIDSNNHSSLFSTQHVRGVSAVSTGEMPPCVRLLIKFLRKSTKSIVIENARHCRTHTYIDQCSEVTLSVFRQASFAFCVYEHTYCHASVILKEKN